MQNKTLYTLLSIFKSLKSIAFLMNVQGIINTFNWELFASNKLPDLNISNSFVFPFVLRPL